MGMSTRLRYAFSKDPQLLVEWVNNLPYKIEIKGSPIFVKGKFHLFYVLPDNADKEVMGGDLDG